MGFFHDVYRSSGKIKSTNLYGSDQPTTNRLKGNFSNNGTSKRLACLSSSASSSFCVSSRSSMNVNDLCRRIASNDATLTQVNAVFYSHEKINALIQALQQQLLTRQKERNCNNNSNNNNTKDSSSISCTSNANKPLLQIQELILVRCELTAESLLQLLSLIHSLSSSPLKTLQLYLQEEVAIIHRNTTDAELIHQLFHGMMEMSTDQQPTSISSELILWHVEDVTLACMEPNWWQTESTILHDDDYFLSRTLLSPHCRLVALHLPGNHLTDDSIQWLASGFVVTATHNNNNTLVELDLCDNLIGNVGARRLARDVLHRFGALRELQLERNQIGDDGAVALATFLSQQQQQSTPPSNHLIPASTRDDGAATLYRLSLGSNQIGNVGLVALIQAISSHPTLTCFDIDHNPQIGLEKGYMALVEAIPRLGTIKSLTLGPFVETSQTLSTNTTTAAAATNDTTLLLSPPTTTTTTTTTTISTVAQLMRKLAAGMEQNHVLDDVEIKEFGGGNQEHIASYYNAMRQHRNIVPPKLSQQQQQQLVALSCCDDFLVMESLQVICFFSNLNRSKLRPVLLSCSSSSSSSSSSSLTHHHVQPSQIGLQLWPLILARLQHVPSVVFYLLQEKPTVVPMTQQHDCDSSSITDDKKRSYQEHVFREPDSKRARTN